MKTKKILIPVFTLSAALLLTACSGKEAADTTKTQTTQTEAGTESADAEFALYHIVLVGLSRKIIVFLAVFYPRVKPFCS